MSTIEEVLKVYSDLCMQNHKLLEGEIEFYPIKVGLWKKHFFETIKKHNFNLEDSQIEELINNEVKKLNLPELSFKFNYYE
jgi:hypothetical protein